MAVAPGGGGMTARLGQVRAAGAFGLAWLALSGGGVAVALVPLVGSVGAYGFVALFAMFALAYPRGSLAALGAVPIVWVLPGLALLSVLWSDAPELTLRYAVQFALSVGCACIAARHLGPRGLVSALLCGLGMAMVLSLAIGRHQVDPLTGQASFVGIFGSKNAVAGHVAILVVAAAAALLDARQSAVVRLLALAALGAAAPVLVRAGSAGALVASLVGLAALAASIALVRLDARERRLVLLALVATSLPLLALLTFAGEALRILVEDVLGKDMTLTGRTVLWQRAQVLIAENPWLGQGFQAFWRHDYVEAEGLWRSFHMPSRTGFNFHNLYLEAAIGLGWTGVAALVGVLVTVTLRLLRRSFAERSAASCFAVAMMAVFLLRSFFEVELLYQFSVPTLVFFALVFQSGEAAATPLRLTLRALPARPGYAASRRDTARPWP